MSSAMRYLLWTVFALLLLGNVAVAANTVDVSLAKNNLILTPVHGGNGAAWGQDRCMNCHVMKTIHQNAPKIRDIVKDKGYASCAGCHGDNGVPNTPRPCLMCHNGRDLPNSPLINEPKNHNFVANSIRPFNDNDCLACHKASDMDGDFENHVDLTRFPDAGGNLTPYSKQTDFCLRCHNQNHQQPEFRMRNTDPNNALNASEIDFLSIDVHGERQGLGNTTYSGLRLGYNYQSIVECTDCHAMHSTHNDKLIIGNSSAGVFKLDSAIRNAKVNVTVSQTDDSQLCVLCHAMKTPVGQAGKDTGNGLAGVHLAGAGSNCRECHAHGKNEKDLQPVKPPTFGRVTGKVLLDATHGKNNNGSAWGIKDCAACHSLSFIHIGTPNIKAIAEQKGYAACTGCHGSNGTDAPRPCAVCHNPVDLPMAPILSGTKSHNFKANTESPLSDVMCVGCHDASDMDGELELDIDFTHFPNKYGEVYDYENSSEFCLSCHNLDHQQAITPITGYSPRHPLVAMENNWNFLDVHGKRKGTGERTYAGLRADIYQYKSVVECVDCHAMHGTHNNKLIIDSTAKGVFKFPAFARNVPFLINTPNGDYSQLCVTCHAMKDLVEDGAKDTGNGIAGVHQVGTDCRTCHTHGMAAQTGL